MIVKHLTFTSLSINATFESMSVLTTSELAPTSVYPIHLNAPNMYLYVKRTPHSVVYRLFSSEPPSSVLKHLPHETIDVLPIAVDMFDPMELESFD